MKTQPALRFSVENAAAAEEPLVEEAPLAIEIRYERGGLAVRRLVATTMRTPGADEDLVWGFLLGEGLAAETGAIQELQSVETTSRGDRMPTMVARLASPPPETAERVSRGLITSACGFCGRTELARPAPAPPTSSLSSSRWTAAQILALPEALRRNQPLFAATGGSHGAALAGPDGSILAAREDVGRHNAVDKVIGAAWRAGWWGLPPGLLTLVLSGRAGYELVQKAGAAGCGLVVAVGAPSTLAVRHAADAGLTLIGFVRAGRFNVYTGAHRLNHGTP